MSQQALFDAPPPVSPLPTRTDPWFQVAGVTLYQGDCIEVMARMPANSVDALVTDGPYGLGFMGQAWDTFAPGEGESRKLDAAGYQHAFHQDDGRSVIDLHGIAVAAEQPPAEIDDRTTMGEPTR